MPRPPSPPAIGAGQVVYEFAVQQRLQGQVLINTFHYIVTDSVVTPGEPTQAGNAFWNYVKVKWKACTVLTLEFEQVYCRVVGIPAVASEVIKLEPPYTGSIDAEPIPLSTAVIVQKRSYFGGKRGRGRIYMGGIPATQVVASRVDPTWMGATLTEFTELLDDVIPLGDTGEMRPFHWSRNVLAETGVRGAEIIAISVDPVLGNQRRRRPGRGI